MKLNNCAINILDLIQKNKVYTNNYKFDILFKHTNI
jgi:hypothetical protein